MAGRPLMVATLLGASIGVPYAVTHSSQAGKAGHSSVPAAPAVYSSTTGAAANSGWGSSPMSAPSFLSTSQPATAISTTSTAAPATVGQSGPIEGVRFNSLAEVLRFDVSREWVYQNWPRKSVGLSDPEYYGVRVPLVTGTTLADLAGSLTYFFNSQGQVQHISFVGRTADTTQLIQLLTTTYGFQRKTALPGQQLYQVGPEDHVTSELRTKPEPVLWATTPQESFSVWLELERPGSTRELPPRGPQLQVPNVPAQPTPPTAAQTAAAKPADAAAADQPWYSYDRWFGGVRGATQAEQNQVMDRRWPN